jgi:NAD(P)-dependent dehydrogenase (short-subunit alcohol dehydrogenase family)
MRDADRAAAVAADGRVGTPTDVVGLTAFLVGDEAARLTGQVLRVRGGA